MVSLAVGRSQISRSPLVYMARLTYTTVWVHTLYHHRQGFRKMRILLLDSGGHFLDFALQCLIAGHQVKLYVTPLKNGDPNTIGDGLVEKVKDWRKWMGWGDLICLSDNDKFMVAMEPYRKLGYPI